MTDYLLDTHALLWWVGNDSRLDDGVRDAVSSSRRTMVSDVSLWELAIKVSVGKFRTRDDLQSWFEHHVTTNRFSSLAISRRHASRVAEIPLHHRDPFDRLLIAQAQLERLVVVTDDDAFADYDVETVW